MRRIVHGKPRDLHFRKINIITKTLKVINATVGTEIETSHLKYNLMTNLIFLQIEHLKLR